MTALVRRPRVLVVDDLEPLAAAMADTLAEAGHDVAVALDCRSARIARFEPPGVDLLLTDLRLVDGSGLVLVAEMLALGRPSVVMSGDVSALDRAAASHPWVATLAKPFHGADLVRSVDQVLSAWPQAWMPPDAKPVLIETRSLGPGRGWW